MLVDQNRYVFMTVGELMSPINESVCSIEGSTISLWSNQEMAKARNARLVRLVDAMVYLRK
jgi:hypothetical protein